MDTITHTVLGACIGEVLVGKKMGKRAMLAGAVANNFPDIDVCSSFWMSQPDSLLAHRGFTHSILFSIALTLISGWLMPIIFKRIKLSRSEWTLLFGINLFVHLLIDSFTVYGTGWFEPFSHYRVSLNILFVADPFYTIALLIATFVLLVMHHSSPYRFKLAMWGIAISSSYLIYAFNHKIKVDSIVCKALQNENIRYSDFISTPTPLNNFLWYIIAPCEEGYHIGYYSVFDLSEKIRFHFLPRNDSLIETLKNNESIKKLIRFSTGYYHIEKSNDTLFYSDLRFGQVGGWDSGDASFVFRYNLAENSDNKMFIQSGRLRASSGATLKSMIARITAHQ